jgi:hypothetical protein
MAAGSGFSDEIFSNSADKVATLVVRAKKWELTGYRSAVE